MTVILFHIKAPLYYEIIASNTDCERGNKVNDNTYVQQ